VILEAVANNLPELLPFATSTLSGPSDLQFGDLTLQSEEEAQQGEPLGPLYSCLAIVKVLKSMKSELVLAYLDDITLRDNAETVLKDFLQLAETASRIGLKINRDNLAVSTKQLTTILLPARLRAVKDSGIDAALAAGPHCQSTCWRCLQHQHVRLRLSQQLNMFGMINVAKHSSVNLCMLPFIQSIEPVC